MATDYGTDMSGTTDITPTLLDVSGEQLLTEVICRRLFTPNASLLSAPDELTCDLRQFCGSTQDRDTRQLVAIKSTIKGALLADPRILSVTVVIDWEPESAFMTVHLTGQGATGPFKLTLAVTAVTFAVLST